MDYRIVTIYVIFGLSVVGVGLLCIKCLCCKSPDKNGEYHEI